MQAVKMSIMAACIYLKYKKKYTTHILKWYNKLLVLPVSQFCGAEIHANDI